MSAVSISDTLKKQGRPEIALEIMKDDCSELEEDSTAGAGDDREDEDEDEFDAF